jgi:hypothetical protein
LPKPPNKKGIFYRYNPSKLLKTQHPSYEPPKVP